MARKTREEAEQTRLLLLDTAEHLFSERGVASTTLGDIAQAAGVTRGAVYWHFQNKLELYRAMLLRIAPHFDRLVVALEAGADDDPAWVLWQHGQGLLRMVVNEPQVQRIMQILYLRSEHVAELAPMQEECLVHMRDMQHRLAQVLIRAAQRGMLWPDVEPLLAAQTLQSCFAALIERSLIDAERFDLRTMAPKMIRYIFRGIFLPEVVAQLPDSAL